MRVGKCTDKAGIDKFTMVCLCISFFLKSQFQQLTKYSTAHETNEEYIIQNGFNRHQGAPF